MDGVCFIGIRNLAMVLSKMNLWFIERKRKQFRIYICVCVGSFNLQIFICCMSLVYQRFTQICTRFFMSIKNFSRLGPVYLRAFGEKEWNADWHKHVGMF